MVLLRDLTSHYISLYAKSEQIIPKSKSHDSHIWIIVLVSGAVAHEEGTEAQVQLQVFGGPSSLP